jgi:hypothetical protein
MGWVMGWGRQLGRGLVRQPVRGLVRPQGRGWGTSEGREMGLVGRAGRLTLQGLKHK